MTNVRYLLRRRRLRDSSEKGADGIALDSPHKKSPTVDRRKKKKRGSFKKDNSSFTDDSQLDTEMSVEEKHTNEVEVSRDEDESEDSDYNDSGVGETSATTDSSFSSTIIMDKVDEKEALDRLLYDLSKDEVSMVIDIFGKGCNISETKQDSLSHPPDSQVEPANTKGDFSFIPVSYPIHHEMYRNDPSGKSLIRNDDGNTEDNKPPYAPLPRSLFQFYRQPRLPHPIWRAIDTVYGENNIHYSLRTPFSGVVSPSTTDPLMQEANGNLILNHPILSLPISSPGEQMTMRESNMGNHLPQLPSRVSPDPQEPKTASCNDNAPLNKRAHSPPGVVRKKANKVGASSRTTKSKTSKGKKKIAPVRKKRTGVKTKPKKAISQGKTYIVFPTFLNDEVWDQRWSEAQQFAKEHGHCRIPTKYAPNPELANWARRQRYHFKVYKKHVLDHPENSAAVMPKMTHYKRCQIERSGMRRVKCLMTAERLAKLESIRFCMDLQDFSWERMYERLCDYARRNKGKTTPSKHCDEELWKWTGTQRYHMSLRKKKEKGGKKSKGTKTNTKVVPGLTPERIAKLNQINFVWEDSARSAAAAGGKKEIKV